MPSDCPKIVENRNFGSKKNIEILRYNLRLVCPFNIIFFKGKRGVKWIVNYLPPPSPVASKRSLVTGGGVSLDKPGHWTREVQDGGGLGLYQCCPVAPLHHPLRERRPLPAAHPASPTSTHSNPSFWVHMRPQAAIGTLGAWSPVSAAPSSGTRALRESERVCVCERELLRG